MIQKNADFPKAIEPVRFPARSGLDSETEKLRRRLAQPDLETTDPTEIMNYLRGFPYRVVAPMMLGWYRSGDLWKVTMASVYFRHSGVMDAIDHLIDEIRSKDTESAEQAKEELSLYGEFALKRVLKSLNGKDLDEMIRRIFTRMDSEGIRFVLRSLRTESRSLRAAALEALSKCWGRHTKPILVDLIELES